MVVWIDKAIDGAACLVSAMMELRFNVPVSLGKYSGFLVGGSLGFGVVERLESSFSDNFGCTFSMFKKSFYWLCTRVWDAPYRTSPVA